MVENSARILKKAALECTISTRRIAYDWVKSLTRAPPEASRYNYQKYRHPMLAPPKSADSGAGVDRRWEARESWGTQSTGAGEGKRDVENKGRDRELWGNRVLGDTQDTIRDIYTHTSMAVCTQTQMYTQTHLQYKYRTWYGWGTFGRMGNKLICGSRSLSSQLFGKNHLSLPQCFSPLDCTCAHLGYLIVSVPGLQ